MAVTWVEVSPWMKDMAVLEKSTITYQFMQLLRRHHEIVSIVALLTMLLVGGITVLYVWVASRQVRPRKIPLAREELPISPTSKRKRRSKSFSDLLDIKREIRDENARLEQHDHITVPSTLQQKFQPEQLKLVYDALSKVFSFLRGEFVEPLAHELRILKFQEGEEIFSKGKHDGSIFLVASGKASLIIHDENDQQFHKTIRRGDTITSSLLLLTALINSMQHEECAAQMENTCGNLSAVALMDHTVIFQIPANAIHKIVEDYPESFFRLAQAALSQVEKITAKALVDHFGLASQIINPVPLVHPLLLGNDEDCLQPSNIAACVESIAEVIELYDEDMRSSLTDCTKVIVRKQNQMIEDQDTNGGVYIVLEGSVTVQIYTRQHQYVDMYTATKGCEIGFSACFVGNPPATRNICQEKTILLWIPEALFCSLLHINSVAVKCARHLLEQLSGLVCITDSSFDWLHLQGGESLFDRGGLCDSVFTVISGRLRAIQVHSYRGKEVETTNELGRGATLGALDMLSAGRINSSVFAIRDSQISQMPRNVFDYVVSKYPKVLIHFTTNLAQHLPTFNSDVGKSDNQSVKGRNNYLLSLGSTMSLSPNHSSGQTLPLGTVAVLSLTKKAKIRTFCSYLQLSLKTLAATDVVSSQKAHAFLGDQWISDSRIARANLISWLGDIESSNEIVIYEGDQEETPWTKLCIRQADHILLLCSDAQPQHAFIKEMVPILQTAWEKKDIPISVVRIREKNWTLSAIETATKAAASDSSRTNSLKKKLRLLKESPMLPRFLLPMEKYEWINGFHNVQVPFKDHEDDFLRLSRLITGNGVGLVLGGGGARGLAHIGVLRALEECEIHVDVVGGTSIGAFIGAMYALHPHDLSLVQSKIFSMSTILSSIVEKLKDLTLPISSFFKGARFNKSIQDFFFELSIEDLMLNYFCVTTDIAKSRMSVHRSGPVWKYVRASMSLQGYLPPISEDGSLLLDGGYMNNLPADVMKEEGGIKYIFAVDVGSEPRREYYSYGSSLSGWWLLWNKLNPFAKTVVVPSMGDVSAALAYVSSEQHKDRMKAECIDLYLRPPVKDYGTLQFDKMEEIIQAGYEYALPRVREWARRVLSEEPDADIVDSTVKSAKKAASEGNMWKFSKEFTNSKIK